MQSNDPNPATAASSGGERLSPSIFDIKSLGVELTALSARVSNVLTPLTELERAGERLTQTFGYLGDKVTEMENAINGSAEAILMVSKNAMTFEQAMKRASEIQVEISKATSRNLISNSKIIGELELASQATETSTQALATNFMAAGYQLTSVKDEMETVAKTAQKLGVNVGAVAQGVVSNMKLMNVYNFQTGIEGLAKMVSKSLVLGANMSNVMNIAEKAFDPEQAITLASDLQRLGVVTSDLLDPLKIMDLGQNNPEELLNQVKNITKGLVEVDEQSGKVRILPGQQLALRNIAGALNMTKEELAEMAIKTGELDYKMSRIKFSPEISEESKEMVANLAQFGEDAKGTKGFVVTLKDEKTNQPIQKLVSELKDRDIKLLEKQSIPKTLEQLAEDQLTVSERMLKALESLASTPRATAAQSEKGRTYKATAEEFTKLIGDESPTNSVRNELIDGFGKVTEKLQEGSADALTKIMALYQTDTLNLNSAETILKELGDTISGPLKNIMKTAGGAFAQAKLTAQYAVTGGTQSPPPPAPPPVVTPPSPPPSPRTTTSTTGGNAFDQILDLYRRGLQNPQPQNQPPVVVPPRENVNEPPIVPERTRTGAELINPQLPTNGVDVRNMNDFASIFNIDSINETSIENTTKITDKLSEVKNSFITSMGSEMVAPSETETNTFNPEKLYAAEFSKIAETYKQAFAENKKSEIPKEVPITIGDGLIGPDGGLIVSGQKGTYSLDKEDYVIAGNFDKPNTSVKNDDDIKPTIEKPSITNIEIPKEFKISNVDDLANLVDITPLKDTLQTNNNLLQQGFSSLDTTLKNEQKDVVLNPNIDVESPKLPEVVLNGVPFPETINIGNVDSFSQVFDNKSVIDALSLQDNKFAGNITELQNTIESSKNDVRLPVTNVEVNVPKQEQATTPIDFKFPDEIAISNTKDFQSTLNLNSLNESIINNGNVMSENIANLERIFLENKQTENIFNPNINVESPKLPEVVLNGTPFPDEINIGNIGGFSQVFDTQPLIEALSVQDNNFAGNIDELQNTIESTQREVKQPITNVEVNMPKQKPDTTPIDFKFPNEIAISNTKDFQSTLNLNPLNESIINNNNGISQSISELERTFSEKYNRPIESGTPKLLGSFGEEENLTPSRKIDFAQSNTDFIKQVRSTFEEFEKTIPKLENKTEKLIVPQTEDNNLFDYDEFAQSMNNNLKVSLEQQIATYVPPLPTDNNLEKIEKVSKTINESKLDMAGKVEFVVKVEGSSENPQMAASFKNMLEREFQDNNKLTDIMLRNAKLRNNSAGILSGKPQTAPIR